MRNRPNVFDVVEGLTFLLSWDPTQRLARINTLENAETAKIFNGDLQHFQTFGSSDEGSFESSMLFLLFLSHAGELPLASCLGAERRLDRLLLGSSFDTVSHGSYYSALFHKIWAEPVLDLQSLFSPFLSPPFPFSFCSSHGVSCSSSMDVEIRL